MKKTSTSYWYNFFEAIFLCTIVVAITYGCVSCNESNNKFEIERLRLEYDKEKLKCP